MVFFTPIGMQQKNDSVNWNASKNSDKNVLLIRAHVLYGNFLTV
jgi:hypothetical protein